jgi:glutathione S-transferase
VPAKIDRMKLKIYRVPASHPCQAVIRAAELKGIEHKVVDLLPLSQPIVAGAMFDSRTVPAMKVLGAPGGTQKVQTTRACLRTIEALVPEPALYPADAEARDRVLAAEEFGIGEFQDVTRRIAWGALRERPSTLFSFDNNLKLPNAAMKPFLKPTIWGERKLNKASGKRVRAELEALPEWIDQIDAFVSEGTIGGAHANAGDLTILSSLWLLRSFGDLVELIDSRPSGRKTLELFGIAPGDVPAGTLPAAWLTNVNAAAAAAA